MLQDEALMLRCTQLPIGNVTDRLQLNQMTGNLADGLRNIRHLCLLPLSGEKTADSISDLQRRQSRLMGDMPLEEFHRQATKLVTDSFHMQCFRYVSVLPGGFELCHRFIADYNKRIIELFVLQEVDALLGRSVAPKDVDLQLGRKMPNLIELVNAHWAMDCYHCQ